VPKASRTVPGYTYGTEAVPRSPVSLAELELIERTIGFAPEDARALERAGQILESTVDAFLDYWYAFQATLPHLGAFSLGSDGEPNLPYRAASRARLRQWIFDTCRRPHDQDWLNYQHEIGLRHTRAKKNQTDGVFSAPHVSFRYVLAQLYPFTQAMRPFLADPAVPPDEVEEMYQAWSKAVLLQVVLWSYPYVNEGDF
jgi:Protoglobin